MAVREKSPGQSEDTVKFPLLAAGETRLPSSIAYLPERDHEYALAAKLGYQVRRIGQPAAAIYQLLDRRGDPVIHPATREPITHANSPGEYVMPRERATYHEKLAHDRKTIQPPFSWFPEAFVPASDLERAAVYPKEDVRALLRRAFAPVDVLVDGEKAFTVDTSSRDYLTYYRARQAGISKIDISGDASSGTIRIALHNREGKVLETEAPMMNGVSPSLRGGMTAGLSTIDLARIKVAEFLGEALPYLEGKVKEPPARPEISRPLTVRL